MKPIPDSVKAHISNARYYLEAADKHPAPTKDAVHTLLLLVAWENIVIADTELSAWANEADVDERISTRGFLRLHVLFSVRAGCHPKKLSFPAVAILKS